jgi:predicted AlkP superfamily phosphohydrolase/phosphomutase
VTSEFAGPPEARGKVLIIGLDGATFDVIEPAVQAGQLPHFRQLMSRGAWGRLASTIPAHSGPAWSTFATGLMPGRHGVFYFMGLTRDERFFRAVSSDSIQGRTLWELAGEQGRTVGVINVPLTYPPRPVNGYMISGLFAPDAASAFWPTELYDEVSREIGEYTVEVYGKVGRRAFLDAVLEAIDRRRAVAEYLMERRPADLQVVVFRMLDSVQHKFWADMDPGHPLHKQLGDGAIPGAILECYQALDDAIGRLMERAGPEATVMVLSDHGFRAEYGRLAINRWLQERGLLPRPRGRSSWLFRALALAKRLGLSQSLGTLLRSAEGARYRDALEERKSLFYNKLEWPQTRAVFGPLHGLTINLRGRDPQGTVSPAEYEPLRETIIKELLALREPRTGRPLIARVHRREDIYQGEHLELAPDLVPETAIYTDDGRAWAYGFNQNPAAMSLFTPPSLRMSGDHAPDGILLAQGPHIQAGCRDGLSIADVAPTALYALGLEVPRAMDGRVLTELFAPSFAKDYPARYADISLALQDRTGESLSAEDQALVESRLRDLGYL